MINVVDASNLGAQSDLTTSYWKWGQALHRCAEYAGYRERQQIQYDANASRWRLGFAVVPLDLYPRSGYRLHFKQAIDLTIARTQSWRSTIRKRYRTQSLACGAQPKPIPEKNNNAGWPQMLEVNILEPPAAGKSDSTLRIFSLR
ncbi:hypothetical protein CW304_32940 [Bacillus sp. UFRGS-B20]|nr:hypothetical protein CW304_32940 [Bacillus sp. UFRGS-B20]